MAYHLWWSCIWVCIRAYVCVCIYASLRVWSEKFCHVCCLSVRSIGPLTEKASVGLCALWRSLQLRWPAWRCTGSSDVFPFGRKPASFHSGFLPTFRSFFIFLLTPHPRSHCNCPLERQLIFVASCVFAQGKNAGFLFAIWQMSKEKDWLHYVFLSAAWMNILCFSSNLEKI